MKSAVEGFAKWGESRATDQHRPLQAPPPPPNSNSVPRRKPSPHAPAGGEPATQPGRSSAGAQGDERVLAQSGESLEALRDALAQTAVLRVPYAGADMMIASPRNIT